MKAFNSIPYYRDKVYDPDPDDKLNRANDTVESALGQAIASSSVSPFDSFPPDDSTLFSEDHFVLPSFVPMDAFEQVKIPENQLRSLPMQRLS